MPSLAELLGYLVQPLGGPGIPALAKAPNNATAGGIPGVQPPKGQPLSSPAELMQALTAIGNAQYENKLREAQAEKFRAEAEEYRAAAKDTPPAGFGQRAGGAPGTAPAVAGVWGSLGAPSTVAQGPTSFSPAPDKSNFASGLRRLTDLGVHPDVAAGAVHYMDRNENGYNPLAVNPTSGAFGRAQWLGPRKTALVSQFGDRPSDDQQADFMGGELLGPERRTLNALLSAKTGKEGYDIWGTHYERPGAAALARAGVGGALRGRPTNQIEQQWSDAGQPASYTSVGPQTSPSGGIAAPGSGIVVDGKRYANPRAWRLAVDAQEAADPGGARFFAPTQQHPGSQAQPPALTAALANVSQSAPPNNINPNAPMSLAPQMPAMPQSQSRFSPEDMAWAMRQDQRNANRGKRNPAAVDQALAMGPGGKDSLDYQGQLASTKATAEMYPALFKDTQLKLLQAGIDISAADKAVIQGRISKEKEQRLADELKNRGEGRQDNPATGGFDPVPGFNAVTASTQSATASAVEEAKRPGVEAMAQFNADLARGTTRRQQDQAAALDPTTWRFGDKEYTGTRAQAADMFARGGAPAVPAAGGMQPGGALPLGRDFRAEKQMEQQFAARITIDTKAAEEAGTQATLSRRLMPLVDEVSRLAHITPEGRAGPIAGSLARGLSAVGIAIPDGLSNAELLRSISQQLVPLVREPGATSEKELDGYLMAVPSLMGSADGRIKVAEMMKTIMQRSIDIAAVYRDNVGAPDLREKLAKFSSTPIFSEVQRAAIDSAQGGAIEDGRTMSNPETGGRMIRRGGKWEPMQ